VNLGVVLAGGYVTTRLAIELRASPWAGLAFALNPLVVASTALDLADGMAVALLVGVVLALRRQRWGVATGLAVLAVLTKETSWLAVAALAIGVPAAGRLRPRVVLAAVPAVTLGAWALYVRSRLPGPGTQVEEVTGVPFGGYSQAYRLAWRPDALWGDAVVAALLVAVAVVIVVRWWTRRTPELWAALPFALLVPFLSGQVVHWSTNSIRAIGPALTFLVLDIAADRATRASPAALAT
jgi:hypothetical protein